MKILFALLLLTPSVVLSQLVDYSGIRGGFSNQLTSCASQSSARLGQLPEPTNSDEQKSVSVAAIYSLLLPGMGELYVGDYRVGKYFTVAEASLWLTWTGFQVYGNWQQTDARNFAIQHAAVNLSGKDDQYFIDIGNFISVYAFNEEVLRERNSYKVYNPNSGSYWKWDTDANRERYRLLRVSSDETFNSSRYIIAAIVVNHVVSAVNAVRMAISHNSNVDRSDALNIRANVIGGLNRPQGVMITFSRTF